MLFFSGKSVTRFFCLSFINVVPVLLWKMTLELLITNEFSHIMPGFCMHLTLFPTVFLVWTAYGRGIEGYFNLGQSNRSEGCSSTPFSSHPTHPLSPCFVAVSVLFNCSFDQCLGRISPICGRLVSHTVLLTCSVSVAYESIVCVS